MLLPSKSMLDPLFVMQLLQGPSDSAMAFEQKYPFIIVVPSKASPKIGARVSCRFASRFVGLMADPTSFLSEKMGGCH